MNKKQKEILSEMDSILKSIKKKGGSTPQDLFDIMRLIDEGEKEGNREEFRKESNKLVFSIAPEYKKLDEKRSKKINYGLKNSHALKGMRLYEERVSDASDLVMHKPIFGKEFGEFADNYNMFVAKTERYCAAMVASHERVTDLKGKQAIADTMMRIREKYDLDRPKNVVDFTNPSDIKVGWDELRAEGMRITGESI